MITSSSYHVGCYASPLNHFAVHFNHRDLLACHPVAADHASHHPKLPDDWRDHLDTIFTGKACFVPISFPTGSAFQKQVWTHLCHIPFGHRVCYSDIAQALSVPNATRAVASAIAKNPLAFVVPCHRVINKNGSLGGFRWGPHLKHQWQTYERECQL